jgi:hypothetical protein
MITTDPRLGRIASFQIQIDSNTHINVNDLGEPLDTVYEGTLGLIIKGVTADGPIALKFPRLAADSASENAYVTSLLQTEAEEASKIVGGVNRAANLVRCVPAQTKGGTRHLFSSQKDRTHEQLDMATVLVFCKGKKPRLFAHKPNFQHKAESRLPKCPVAIKKFVETYWPAISDDNAQTAVFSIKETDLDTLAPQNTQESPTHYSVSGKEQEGSSANGFPTLESVLNSQVAECWCLVLPPCAAYEWFETNLQEALAVYRPKFAKWKLAQHMQLVEKIAAAVAHYLHCKQKVHCDIRPANIFISSMEHTGDPSEYFLGDYGSFSGQAPAALTGGGLTLIGVTTGKHRVSPFYNAERRTGLEYESANEADISYDPDTRNYIIRLGWTKRQLRAVEEVDPRGDTTAPPASEESRTKAPPSHKAHQEHDEHGSANPGIFAKDDFVQIKDFVFKVVNSKLLSDNSYELICDSLYGKVLHDRFTLNRDELLVPGDRNAYLRLAIPRYTHIRQWSYATDLFSLGVLLLYTLFTVGTEEEKLSTLDDDFATMISVLESIDYAQKMWEEIAAWVAEALRHSESKIGDELSYVPFNYLHGSDGSDLARGANHTASYLTQTVPHLLRVAVALDSNVAELLFVIFFSLGCMHRRDNGFKTVLDAPFNTALDSQNEKAAERALSFLSKITAQVSSRDNPNLSRFLSFTITRTTQASGGIGLGLN